MRRTHGRLQMAAARSDGIHDGLRALIWFLCFVAAGALQVALARWLGLWMALLALYPAAAWLAGRLCGGRRAAERVCAPRSVCFCRRCGARLPQQARFCGCCGTEIEEERL